MQFLDSKKYYLNQVFDKQGQGVGQFFSSEFERPSQIQSVGTFVNQNYFKVLVRHKNTTKEICCDRGARVSKINDGVFGGGVVIVENDSRFSKNTMVTALTNDTIFKFPVFDGQLLDGQIDYLLSDEGLSQVVLGELLTFDISKKYQYYDFICDDIPKDFWRIENIKQKLMSEFAEREIQYVNTENPGFIDERLVRARAIKTIEKHIEKAKIKTEENEK